MRGIRFWVALLAAGVLALTGCTPGGTGGGEAGGGGNSPSPTQSPPPGGAAAGAFAQIPDIVQRVEPSVVTISTGSGVGSGVVYESGGVIVTNAHVVGNARNVTVILVDGTQLRGRVVATDTVTDLAVIRVQRDLPPVEFVQGLPQVGELVLAMGSPLGFENSVTAGIVSGVGRDLPGSAQQSRALVDLIQTDAAISPGNSGGALVNGAGKVVGVNEAYIPPNRGAVAIGFAIPAPTVTDTVDELLADGTAEHPYVGIVPGRITPQTARALNLDVQSGVLVVEAVQGGPAASAGLQRGDVIVALGGKQVGTVEAFLGELRNAEPGDTVQVTFVRQGERRTVDVQLGRLEPQG